MPEWLRDAFHVDPEVSLPVLAVRLLVALALGLVVAGIYRVTHGKGNSQSLSLMATLVLLTVLIGMVTLVIGNSVARAFSLVGALAIVRFRTVVEDTRDTAFVIFAVAVGMAAGTGFIAVPLVGIPIVSVAAFLFKPRAADGAAPAHSHLLTVRVGAGQDPIMLLRACLQKHLQSSSLAATGTARQGAAIELTYAVRLRQDEAALALIQELNGIEGVQSVELRQM